MASTLTCSAVIHKDFAHLTAKPVSLGDRVLIKDVSSIKKDPLLIPLSSVRHSGRKWLAVHPHIKPCLRNGLNQKDELSCLIQTRSSFQFKKFIEADPFMVHGMEGNVKSTSQNSSQKVNLDVASGNTGKQIKVLDSYLGKLQEDTSNQQASPGSDSQDIYRDEFREITASNDNMIANFAKKIGLGSLENYFGKLSANFVTQSSNPEISSEEHPDTGHYNEKYREDDQTEEKNPGNFASLSNNNDGMTTSMSVNKHCKESSDGGSDFYLISLIVSINTAVFLFALASPVGNSSLQQLSLPLIYGAKVNKLILDGEWWRLVTPMFLHSGFLHLVFSCWALLSFGPQVCKGYGALTFLLIYILGGVCANVTSFLHTPELTVCGTGPVFALIGAWLMYQFQNKAAISAEVSESMYWKAVVATVLSFLLPIDGGIDEWTNLGAALAGIFYGYLTCPTTKLDNTPAEEDQKEGIALVGQQANTWKSILTFIASIFTLSSLVYMFDPGVDLLDLTNFVD